MIKWGEMDKGLGRLLDKGQGHGRKRAENHRGAGSVGFDMGIRGGESRERLIGCLQGLTDGIVNQG